MNNWLCLDISYQIDCSSFFYDLLAFNYPIWLDSCAHAKQGRYDILSADPRQTLSQNNLGEISSSLDGAKLLGVDFLEILQNVLPAKAGKAGEFVFSGALGYFSYEFGVKRVQLSCRNELLHDLPEAWFGIYPWAIIVDHKLKVASLLYQDKYLSRAFLDKVKCLWQNAVTQPKPCFQSNFQLQECFNSNNSFLEYKTALNMIHQHLIDGKSYQVNYSHCFSAKFKGDPFFAYALLRQKNPSQYAAFLRLPQGDILSFSPELLVQGDKQQLLTKPIKGTAARSFDLNKDKLIMKSLLNCPKNRAENMMIVDLLRNDLSKISTNDSVNVDAFLTIETMPSVFHLVSTISALLSKNYNYFDVIKALFPGGSITGAPKHRTMQLIEELEKSNRSIYCGAIGHISPEQNMCFNIAIRTMIAANGTLYCNAGGGIVLDSDVNQEYQETLDKVFVLTKTLQDFSEIISESSQEESYENIYL